MVRRITATSNFISQLFCLARKACRMPQQGAPSAVTARRIYQIPAGSWFQLRFPIKPPGLNVPLNEPKGDAFSEILKLLFINFNQIMAIHSCMQVEGIIAKHNYCYIRVDTTNSINLQTCI